MKKFFLFVTLFALVLTGAVVVSTSTAAEKAVSFDDLIGTFVGHAEKASSGKSSKGVSATMTFYKKDGKMAMSYSGSNLHVDKTLTMEGNTIHVTDGKWNFELTVTKKGNQIEINGTYASSGGAKPYSGILKNFVKEK
jgi:outer membrane lipoprotein-sorting protein